MRSKCLAILAAVALTTLLAPAAARAATGPLSAPTGRSGGLRVLPHLALSFGVPAAFRPYYTVNGNRQFGSYFRTLQGDDRSCRVILDVQGRVQHRRPSLARLTDDDFTRTSSGTAGARTWYLGRQGNDWLAVSWRRATPATRRYGHYIAVQALITTQDAPTARACASATRSQRDAAASVAKRWLVTRR